MYREHFKKFLLTLFILIPFFSISQNIDYGWKVSSRKIEEGKFELIFSTKGVSGFQLYAPNQIIEDVRMAELVFSDSSILILGNFIESGEKETIQNKIFIGESIEVYEQFTSWKIAIQINGVIPANVQGVLNYYYGNQEEFNLGTPFSFSAPLEGGVSAVERITVPSLDINNPVSNCGDTAPNQKNLFTIFLLGILGGIIALLTPCVFPMIPVTVSFFTKKIEHKSTAVSHAIIYGIFIFLIYIAITIPFHIANETISPEIFNNISTNVWLNILFFIIFVVFAFSFFGFFEIGLPASWANKINAQSGLANLGGIFFMSATLVVVSFSCTGPILGTLLVGVAELGAWPLTVGAAGFGLALGLPFALFALFPKWLNNLPKSGGWMTNFKVVLGFIELALAIKFFSNADLVEQWGLLKREIFIGLWIVIGILIVLYLIGKIRFPHDSVIKKFSFIRIAFIIFFTIVTLYLIPGLTNSKWADLKLISGFPPPRTTYSIYNSEEKKKGLFEPLQNDYAKALELAMKEQKPILIDFTGWACINCRRMEEKVWSDPRVDSLFRTNFIVVSLYVDERKKLPLDKQTKIVTSANQEKSIITVGDKWSTFQTENFGATSQPQYAIITADEKLLVHTKFYTPDADEFLEWLQCGLSAFEKNKKSSRLTN